MKKLVVFPSDPIEAYIALGQSYEYLSEYYNPGYYFDKVYCISPWGETKVKKIGRMTYIKAHPFQFRYLIKKIQPNAVRAYGGYCCSDWASYSRIKDIPIIVSIHDTNEEYIHPSVKYADFVVCMAECVKEAVLKKINFDERKIFVMPNRIYTDLFKRVEDKMVFDRLNQKFGRGRHILHVGRKNRQKNLDTLIKSLQYLEEDVSVIFVGRGDDTEYKILAEKYKVSDRCYWVEAVEREELPYWYSWCDCFCVPSRWEGFGYVFVEAAGCECAIVTSNIAPMNEYLTDGLDSILCDDYEEPKELGKALKRALNSDNDIVKMKKNARKVGLRFSKNIVDEMEIEIYKKAITAQSIKTKNNHSLRLKAEAICQYGLPGRYK